MRPRWFLRTEYGSVNEDRENPTPGERSPDRDKDQACSENSRPGATSPILPILQPTLNLEPEPTRSETQLEDSQERLEDEGWPRPSWSGVLFAIALVSWLFSPRGFLVGRFLSDVFLWLATVCFILGLLILISDWVGAALTPENQGTRDDEDFALEEPSEID